MGKKLPTSAQKKAVRGLLIAVDRVLKANQQLQRAFENVLKVAKKGESND